MFYVSCRIVAEPQKEFKPKESGPRPQIKRSPTESDPQFQELERWIFYIAILALLYFALMWLWGVLGGGSFFRTLARWPWGTILFVMKIGAVAFSVGGIYAIMRFMPKMMVLRGQLTAAPETAEERGMTVDEKEIHRAWRAVEEQLVSQNGSDWKLAVMSADAVMGEALEDMKIEGATMADKLKALGESHRLRSYEQLWDAHKVRNEIAHEPRRALSQEEARRIVQHFADALKELGAM